MKTLLDVFNETAHGKVHAKEVSDGIQEILKTVIFHCGFSPMV